MAAPSPTPTDDRTAPDDQRSSRTGVLMLCAAAAVILVVSLTGGGTDPASDSSRPPLPPQITASASPDAAGPSAPRAGQPAGQAAGKRLPRSRPVRLLIPKISVDAPFTDLAVGPTGQLDPPPAADTNLVGWHAKGASPGEAGTAIIAGHVDTKTSAAVFVNLSALDKGDVFYVRRADGRKARFRVDDVESFAKDDFPDRRVYGDTPQAQVRLITCAGAYDRVAKDYTENLVVFAHLD
ncbi:class F sortase [Streptomyces phaeofaciens JCM 4814]|uniref:Class F sortase n=1 Tax=Streptomyces phaeofaciens TaxID=68254 RepID=A0A918HPB5_9ACTN|nr:class F sortase [Streptomyces phaeofaciens]GGT90760.1 class F sortase [Streptomyces phaeofaciens]